MADACPDLAERWMNAALSLGSAGMVHPANRTDHLRDRRRRRCGTRQTQEDGNVTRFASLLIAAAVAATVGSAAPGQAHDWRQGNRCDWVYNGQGNHGFQYRGQLQQFQFGNFGFGWRQLGPRQIRQALRYQGFYRIRDITRHRGVYSAVAVDRHGDPRQVFVHPGSGQVLCVSRIGHRGRGHRDTVRRAHDRDFARDRDRQPDRGRDTVRRGQDRDSARNRDAQPDRNRNRDTVRRAQDRDSARNRDRQPDRNRDTARRAQDRDSAGNRDRQPDRNRDRDLPPLRNSSGAINDLYLQPLFLELAKAGISLDQISGVEIARRAEVIRKGMTSRR